MDKPVNDLVDAVYVLSVRKFKTRIQNVEKEMAKFGIDFKFVFDHDADQISESEIADTFLPSDMKITHQSLVMKNIFVWKDALANGYSKVLVFEDDVGLSERFNLGFNEAMRAMEGHAPGWMVFLGGLDAHAPSAYFRSTNTLVEMPLPTTEGCVYDQEAIRRRLEWLGANKVGLPADHLMNRMDREMGNRQYWLRHPIVEQGSVTGLFDSVLDGGRQKHSLLYNKMRYRWKRFCRRQVRDWLGF